MMFKWMLEGLLVSIFFNCVLNSKILALIINAIYFSIYDFFTEPIFFSKFSFALMIRGTLLSIVVHLPHDTLEAITRTSLCSETVLLHSVLLL